MNKQELIKAVSVKTGVAQKELTPIVESIFNVIKKTLQEGTEKTIPEKVKISGFGTFELRKRAPRKARNIHTGEIMDILPRFAPHISWSQQFKDELNINEEQ